METTEPVVCDPLMEINVSQSDDSAAAVTDSTSIQHELLDVDDQPDDGWTPKSLLERPSRRKIQDDVISSSEATQTGMLHYMQRQTINSLIIDIYQKFIIEITLEEEVVITFDETGLWYDQHNVSVILLIII